MKHLNIKTIMALLTIILSLSQQAQTPSNRDARQQARERQQFRQAQRYQHNNQYENAVKILEILYQNNPGNLQYYQELFKSYLHLSMLPEAKQLIQRQRAKDPSNPRYDIDYGNLLFKSDQKDEAMKVWEEALRSHSENVGVYTMVANVLTSNRLFDEAVAVYTRAYEKHPDKHYLLKTLADYYRGRLQYYEALKYYLQYLKKDPRNYQMIVRQILSFNVEGQQADSLLQLLTEEAEKFEDREEIQIIIAKFFQKYERYREALQIYRGLENTKTGGKYLIEFGRSAQSDSVYDLAAEAYMEIINRFPQSPFVLPAYLYAAKCNLEIARQTDDQAFARKAVDMIKYVQENYPGHGEVARLSLLEGDIYRQFFFDIDRAISIYREVAETYRNDPNIRESALLNAGESYIIRGDLDAAESALKKVTSTAQAPRARYFLAKVAYYRGEYEEAKTHLDQIVKMEGLAGPITNDALNLQMILSNAQPAPEALKLYAEADWLLYQEKKSEAVSKLENALEKPAPPHFRIRIIFEAARLSAEIGKYAEALDYCNRVLKEKELHFYTDEALFIMAGIVDRQLGDLPRAFELYDRILAEFPDSQFAIPARERLKEIREQNPNLFP